MRSEPGTRRISTWTLALAVGLAAGTPAALAASPTHRVIELDELATLPTSLCGFPIERHITGTLRINEFVRADGTVWRSIVHGANRRVTFTNLETRATYSSVSSVTEHSRIEADGSMTVVLTGVLGHILEPGEGLVSADLGRVELSFGPEPLSPPTTLSQSGIWSEGDIEPLCEALGA